MAEIKTHSAAGVAGKLRTYWPWALVAALYICLMMIPARIGESVIVQNLRLIGTDRVWLLGVFYGLMPSSGQPCSFRQVMANLARLSFGVALIAAAVTLFPSLIPTFYLLPALAITGAGAFLGSLSGPRGLQRAVRHAMDKTVSFGNRLFRTLTLAVAGALIGFLTAVWGFEVFARHDWTALAYGFCGLWGIVIAKPALAGRVA